jgi:hypothetical protein
MAAAPILFMSEATLTLDVTGATAALTAGSVNQVTTAEVIATAGPEKRFAPLDATGGIVRVGVTTYALHLVAGQDWRTPEGLARYLFDNDGAEAAFTLTGFPGTATADTPTFSGTVRLVAPTYGGSAEEFAELDVTLPIVSGKPTLVTS